MKPAQWILICFLLLFSLMQTGCAGFNRKLKSMLGGGGSAPASQAAKTSTTTKFSDSPDISPRVKRQYKRTTKESLSDESSLDAKAGSLWVMEGQGAYLFSQNIVRLLGDPLAVTLEGDPKDQLQSKVNVIRKLLAKIEERQRARMRGPASEEENKKDAKGKDKKDKDAKETAKKEEPASSENAQDLSVKTIPTRVVERTVEGNYRVKGTQPFMIGSREYKIIVTGIVKPEDFNEEGIPATKLLDSKFDIVSARRKEGEM